MATVCNSTLNVTCFLNVTTTESHDDHGGGDDDMVGILPKGLYLTFIWLILILGLIGNILIFVVMTHVSYRRMPFSVYLRFLAVFDSLVLISVCTEDILDHQYGDLGKLLDQTQFGCKCWTYIGYVTRFISPWFVVILSLDRYFTVVFPKKTEIFCTLKAAIIISVVASLFALLEGIVALVHVEITDEGLCYEVGGESLENYLNTRNLLLQSALPCFLILVLNAHVIIMFRRRSKFRESFVSVGNEKKPPKDKITISLIAVTLAAFLTLVPKAILEVMEFYWERDYDDYRDSLPEGATPKGKPGYLANANDVWPLLNLISLLNFSQNFYVMMATGPRYRRVFKSLFCRCLPSRSGYGKDDDSSKEMEETHVMNMISSYYTYSYMCGYRTHGGERENSHELQLQLRPKPKDRQDEAQLI